MKRAVLVAGAVLFGFLGYSCSSDRTIRGEAWDFETQTDSRPQEEVTARGDTSENDFQIRGVCTSQRQQKDALIIKGETYAPQQEDGCVIVPIVDGGEADASQISTPSGWVYSGGEVAAERCLELGNASTVSPTSAFGTVDLTTDEEGEPSMVEFDVLLEFPTDSSNPYSRYVRLQGIEERPTSSCPHGDT